MLASGGRTNFGGYLWWRGISIKRLRGRDVVTIRLLITDDHKVVRQGLRMVLELDPDLEVVGEASNGEEALRRAPRLEPDGVLMDLLMPVMSGIEATGEIRRVLPSTEADELRRALKAAAAGQVQLAPEAAARLMREVRDPESPEALTGRETEVLKLLARGKADKQIARELFIGESTVKSHVHSILAKLNVRSRTQAALYAVRVGLVPADELGEESR